MWRGDLRDVSLGLVRSNLVTGMHAFLWLAEWLLQKSLRLTFRQNDFLDSLSLWPRTTLQSSRISPMLSPALSYIMVGMWAGGPMPLGAPHHSGDGVTSHRETPGASGRRVGHYLETSIWELTAKLSSPKYVLFIFSFLPQTSKR